AGRSITFGGDIHPPGSALLVGQRYADVPSYADWTGPILSHAETFANRGFSYWARLLTGTVPGLGEDAALQLVYRLTGYDGMGYPSTIAELGVGQPDGEYQSVPLLAMIKRDVEKSRLYASRLVPSYPIVRGGHWPDETVHAIARHSDEVGHDGIIYQ